MWEMLISFTAGMALLSDLRDISKGGRNINKYLPTDRTIPHKFFPRTYRLMVGDTVCQVR